MKWRAEPGRGKGETDEKDTIGSTTDIRPIAASTRKSQLGYIDPRP